MELRVGCSGWFYWHWKGKFYPEDKPTHHWFKHYRRRFNTVELNAPFYSWPKPATVKQWRRQATRNFRYAIKVNRLITHEKRFLGTAQDIKNFYDIANVVGPHFGCFLFQCPPSLKYEPGLLRTILDQLSPDFTSVVEFRHRSWWNEDVYESFRQRGIIFCSVSGPRLPPDLIQTHPQVYIRFHGVNAWYRYDYNREELRHWAFKISKAAPSTAWVYFNNDYNAFAIKNARILRKQLKDLEKEELTDDELVNRLVINNPRLAFP